MCPSNHARNDDCSASRQPLLIDPVIVRGHVSIDERTGGIQLRAGLGLGEQFVHRLLPLPRCEAYQQGERLGAPERLAGGPLGKGRG